MPPSLILNADDFGLTPGINRAIAGLHHAHALTSATLMATGPAFADAVAIAHAQPSLGIGCHLLLVDGLPVSRPAAIPTLLGPDRRTFRTSLLNFTRAILTGIIREEEIEREAIAQIQKLQRAGLHVTHLDTHKHTHLFPPVARALCRAAQQTGVLALRNPFEPAWARALGQGTRLRRLQMKLLDLSFRRSFENHIPSVITTGGTIGISATGNLTRTTLSQLLAALPPAGTFELVVHPGYHDAELDAVATRLRAHREIERESLLALIPTLSLNPNGPRLIHYGDLAALRATESPAP